MQIAAPHLANLVEFASYLGFAEPAMRCHLTSPDLDLTRIENSVSHTELHSIICELLNKSGDGYFGLHYGCFMNIKAMGLIYTISKSATDIEQVILLLNEFLKNTFPIFEFTTSTTNNTISIRLTCSLQNSLVTRHLLDTLLCVMYRELKLITNPACQIHVYFPYVNVSEYRKMLGIDAKRGSTYKLTFSRGTNNESLRKKSQSAIGELLPAYLHLLERAKGIKNFSGRVKKMILSMSSPELPDFEKVVSQFAMSSRSFQRKLTEEGNSFRKISDQVKQDLSKYLRKGKNLKTQDIAYLLGYSEASGYLHAVKKWKQC